MRDVEKNFASVFPTDKLSKKKKKNRKLLIPQNCDGNVSARAGIRTYLKLEK